MRLDQAVTAARMAGLGYTSFLVPPWSQAERSLLRHGVADPASQIATLESDASHDPEPAWNVVATASARVALRGFLECAGIGAGAEVAIPSFSCAGLVDPILQAGMRPVLVDIDEELNMSVESLQSAAGPSLAVVVVPHLAGVPAADLAPIRTWADDAGVLVVEDVAQAAGLTVAGRPVGRTGHASIFSCGPGKPLFGPGGGWLATPDGKLADRLRYRLTAEEPAAEAVRHRDFARRYLGGGPSRVMSALRDRRPAEDRPLGLDLIAMSGVQAAIAGAQRAGLTRQVQGRREHATRWRTLLEDAALPVKTAPPHGTASKFWIVSDDDRSRRASLALRRALRAAGVQVEPLYVPLHRRPEYERRVRVAILPTTDRLCDDVYSVPVRSNLTASDWARIERAVAATGRTR